MATEPKVKAKRVMGPRVVKDKVVYITYKGDLDKSSINVHFDADAVFEIMDTDPEVKRIKVTIPSKAKKAPVPPAQPA